ncbi:MAG: GGDEF domain-containing protein [Candidatus Woesearchaeota archaeon]
MTERLVREEGTERPISPLVAPDPATIEDILKRQEGESRAKKRSKLLLERNRNLRRINRLQKTINQALVKQVSSLESAAHFYRKTTNAKKFEEIGEVLFSYIDLEYRRGEENFGAEIAFLKRFNFDWFWEQVRHDSGISLDQITIALDEELREGHSSFLHDVVLPRAERFLLAQLAYRQSFGYVDQDPLRSRREAATRVLTSVYSQRAIWINDTSKLPATRVIPGIGSQFTFIINEVLENKPDGKLLRDESLKYEKPRGYVHMHAGEISHFDSDMTNHFKYMNQPIFDGIKRIRERKVHKFGKKISEAANKTHELEVLFPKICEIIRSEYSRSEINLLLLDNSGQPYMWGAYGNDSKEKRIRGKPVPSDNMVSALFLGRKEGAMCRDIHQLPEVQECMPPEIREKINGLEPKSVVKIGISTNRGEKAVGILEVANRGEEEGSGWGEEDLEILTQTAQPLAYAILRSTEVLDVRRKAWTDPLTGLRNRRGLENDLPEKMKGRFSILYIDFDRMHEMNEKYGHHNVDLAIKEVVATARKYCRADNDILYRCSDGDEFAMLMSRTDLYGAVFTANKIIRAIRDIEIRNDKGEIVIEKGTVNITIGAAQYAPGMTPKDLLENADIGTIVGKAFGGRGHITPYTRHLALYRLLNSPEDAMQLYGRLIEKGFDPTKHIQQFNKAFKNKERKHFYSTLNSFLNHPDISQSVMQLLEEKGYWRSLEEHRKIA